MSERILIASEDDDSYRHLLKLLGEDAADTFFGERAGSLVATIVRLRLGNLAAVLLDLALPGNHGLSGLRRVRNAASGVPIMLLCAPADEPLARRALALGAQGYLIKDHCPGYLLIQILRGFLRQRRSQLERGRAEVTLDSIGDAVIGTDVHGRVDYLNNVAETMTGWPREEARGQPIERVMPRVGGTAEVGMPTPVGLALVNGQALSMSVGTLLVRRDSTRVAIEDSVAPIREMDGRISGAVVVFHDVTEARAVAMRMAYLAQHDSLTRLPNRVLLDDRIDQAIGLARRHGSSIALMFLDLDHFKQINDRFGHAGGDQLLKSVAQRLSSCVRSSDTVSRNGGDEFIVLLAGGHKPEDAGIAAEKILRVLAAPHRISGQKIEVTTSIGISVFPGDAEDAIALLKSADTAMYHAKQLGRNNYQFFHHDMNMQAIEQRRTEKDLAQALRRQELVLRYLPRVDLKTNAVIGAETLLHWQHPQRGLLLADSFMALSKASDLIVPIGHWVLNQACWQARRWQEQGLFVTTMALSVSAIELHDPGFTAVVDAALSETELPAACLQLQIAEDFWAQDVPGGTAILHRLKSLGVQLALGDFDTGRCDLRSLLELPLDVLKIGRSCVRAIDDNDRNSALAGALISLARRLGYRVVAEGVESHSQFVALKAEHCCEAQGGLFGQDLSARQFVNLLQQTKVGPGLPPSESIWS